MNASPCHCSRMLKRRAMTNGAGWIIPGLILLLMPKCPLCLAAMFSVLLGIGLSDEASTVVHNTALLLCGFAIALFATRQVISLVRCHFSNSNADRSAQSSAIV